MPVLQTAPRLSERDEIEQALARALDAWPSIRAAWLFGSLATASAGPLSDVGAHILSGHFKESPREYGEIVPMLARHGVLDAALGERLLKVAGFRNVLMHEYAAVDFALVHEKLGQLDDLAAFAAALDAWLTAQGL